MRNIGRFTKFGLATSAVLASNAFAAGYELPILWSGRYGGIVGAATSVAAGPEALVFNPAGLVDTRGKVEASVAIAPMILAKKAPLVPTSGNLTQGVNSPWSRTDVLPNVGLFASTKIGERVGLGLGAYTYAGAGGSWGQANYGPSFPALLPEFSGGILFRELSFGGGVTIVPGLKIGAAWRVTQVISEGKAGSAVDINSDRVPDLLYEVRLDNMEDTVFNGMRFGVMYSPENAKWGIGATARTSVDYTLKGESSGRFSSANSNSVSQLNTTPGKIAMTGTLPWQLQLAGHGDISDKFRIFGQFEYINYRSNRRTEVSGDMIGSLDPKLLSTNDEWRNLYVFRAATEYKMNQDIRLRGGYSFHTAVTPTNQARFNIPTPGVAHTAAFGAGSRFLDDRMGVDGAVSASYLQKTVDNASPPSLNGTYAQWEVTIHTGVSYAF